MDGKVGCRTSKAISQFRFHRAVPLFWRRGYVLYNRCVGSYRRTPRRLPPSRVAFLPVRVRQPSTRRKRPARRGRLGTRRLRGTATTSATTVAEFAPPYSKLSASAGLNSLNSRGLPVEPEPSAHVALCWLIKQ